MHWAEPAHATRFMELVRGRETSDAAFQAAAALAKAIGKEPSLVLKDVPAFVVNRLGYAMYREAFHLLESGVADKETIDRSFRNAVGLWATFCGPLRWMDLTGGPALYAKAMAGVLPTLSNATELPKSLAELADADARGIANGRGFYEYTEQDVRQWEERFREHAWTVRKLVGEYFPLKEP
jgi:3-hydroxybutyryl-CoA dehydrogenase